VAEVDLVIVVRYSGGGPLGINEIQYIVSCSLTSSLTWAVIRASQSGRCISYEKLNSCIVSLNTDVRYNDVAVINLQHFDDRTARAGNTATRVTQTLRAISVIKLQAVGCGR